MSKYATIFALLIAFAASGCAATPDQDSPDELVGRPEAPKTPEVNRGTLWYGVAMRDDRLEVAVRLWNPPRGTTRFFLPGPWAGRTNHADQLSIGEATSPEGPTFLTIDRSTGRIDIESRDHEWIELRYSVTMRNDDVRFAPRYRDGVAVLFGPTFLVLPSQQVLDQTRDIPIEVHAPEGWNVMTTWSPRAEKPSTADAKMRVHGFMASDGAALRDAFLVTGESMRTFAPVSTAQTTVAFAPGYQGDAQAVTNLIGTVMHGYRSAFGDLGPTRVFVDASKRYENEPLGGLGRRGGFLLQLPPKSADPEELALLVAHEALHLWNGHHYMPQTEAEASTRWFKEGVTHYLAIKFALRWGLIGFEFAAEELAQIAANYSRNPLARGARGSDLDQARFPYDQGALLALEVDAALGRASAGRVGVEHWLGAIRDVSSSGQYNRETLKLALREVAVEIDSDAPAVLRRHLAATQPVDLRALFHRADLHWLPSSRSRKARVIALDRETPLYAMLFGLKDTP